MIKRCVLLCLLPLLLAAAAANEYAASGVSFTGAWTGEADIYGSPDSTYADCPDVDAVCAAYWVFPSGVASAAATWHGMLNNSYEFYTYDGVEWDYQGWKICSGACGWDFTGLGTIYGIGVRQPSDELRIDAIEYAQGFPTATPSPTLAPTSTPTSTPTSAPTSTATPPAGYTPLAGVCATAVTDYAEDTFEDFVSDAGRRWDGGDWRNGGVDLFPPFEDYDYSNDYVSRAFSSAVGGSILGFGAGLSGAFSADVHADYYISGTWVQFGEWAFYDNQRRDIYQTVPLSASVGISPSLRLWSSAGVLWVDWIKTSQHGGVCVTPTAYPTWSPGLLPTLPAPGAGIPGVLSVTITISDDDTSCLGQLEPITITSFLMGNDDLVLPMAKVCFRPRYTISEVKIANYDFGFLLVIALGGMPVLLLFQMLRQARS